MDDDDAPKAIPPIVKVTEPILSRYGPATLKYPPHLLRSIRLLVIRLHSGQMFFKTFRYANVLISHIMLRLGNLLLRYPR